MERQIIKNCVKKIILKCGEYHEENKMKRWDRRGEACLRGRPLQRGDVQVSADGKEEPTWNTPRERAF